MIADEMITEPAAAYAAAPAAAPASDGAASDAASKKPSARRAKKTAEAPAESADSAAEAPKKRRGRPRKADSEASSAAKSVDAEAAFDASGEKPAAKPKRATRRTKSAASAEQASDGVSVPAEKASSEQVAPSEKTADDAAEAKPARRTRRKASAAAPEAENDAQAAKKEQAEEAPKTRKRPGRSTKLRAAVEASEKEAAQSDASLNEVHENATSERDGSSEAGAEERAGRRRAGRPRKSVQIDASSNEESVAEADASASEGETKADGNAQRYQKRDRSQRVERSDRQNKGENRDSRSARDNRNDRNDRNGKNQRDNRDNRNNRNDRTDRHNRRDRNNRRDQYAPKTNIDDLSALRVAELREKAAEFEIEITAGMKKAELVDKVFEASVRAEGFIEVTGILDIMQDGYGFLRTKGYLPSEHDVYIGTSVIRRNNLRKGDMVKGQTRPARENEKYAALQTVISVNGIAPEEQGRRVKFADLTPIFPDEPLTMEHGHSTITARVIDLVSPIGKGQRGLIVSPPKAGKTTVLKDIAAAITANNPSVHLMCLLVDERPEEVTDMQRSIAGEVIASTFDMPTEDHIQVSELVIERAKRLVEMGQDVVILLDSLTRLARAYNLATPASGRILSGGVDSTALYPPKRFLGAARNIEGGGSLTILASALIETGSKMDEVIFEEFKGTGNMELKLDRSLADRRIFPAIDPIASGTRREDLLLDPQEAPVIWAVRRILANMNNTERAMDMLIKSLKQTDDNKEFLMRTAKKGQGTTTSRDTTLM